MMSKLKGAKSTIQTRCQGLATIIRSMKKINGMNLRINVDFFGKRVKVGRKELRRLIGNQNPNNQFKNAVSFN